MCVVASYRNSEASTPPTSLWDDFDEDEEEEEDNFLFEEYDDYDDHYNEHDEEHVDEFRGPEDNETVYIAASDNTEQHEASPRSAIITDNLTESAAAIQPAALVSETADTSWQTDNSGASKGERDERSLEVKFQSVVKHSVSAVVTWKESCEEDGHMTR